jgi:hypothetical protein
METVIDFRALAQREVKAAIMEEVNNLGVRAAVKEQVETVGELDKDAVRDIIRDVVDSYVRSVDVEKLIQQVVDGRVATIVDRKVSAVVERYLEGTFSSYKPTKQLEELILNDLKKQFYANHNLKVIDTMKENNQ